MRDIKREILGEELDVVSFSYGENRTFTLVLQALEMLGYEDAEIEKIFDIMDELEHDVEYIKEVNESMEHMINTDISQGAV